QGERWLPPPRLVVDVDRRHPLHPPEATAAGRYEPRGSAVAGGQWSASNVGRHEQRGSIGAREPTAVAGDRSDDDRSAVGAVEQSVQACASPLLLRVPPAG